VSGAARRVKLWPSPTAGMKFSAGGATRTVMPLMSLCMTVAWVVVAVLGVTPPPQAFVLGDVSSFPLAVSDVAPSAASRACSAARRERLTLGRRWVSFSAMR
jgi:hypothetical protein